MRIVKFRVWDNHYKYMNYKVLVGVYGEWEKVKDDENYTACSMWIEPNKVDYKCEPHWTHFEPYHKDIHLMQYTGLKDKNGKEIYEGDIVQWADIKMEVFWGEDIGMGYGFCWRNIKGENEYHESMTGFIDEYEVIGNIYENPELLGGSNE